MSHKPERIAPSPLSGITLTLPSPIQGEGREEKK